MRLIPYDISKIERMKKMGVNMALIMEFAESEQTCVKVEGFVHKTATSCANALNRAVARTKMYNIMAISRKGEVFLIKDKK